MIKINNLVVGYYGQKVSLSIHGYIRKGSMVAIIGENGSGKSTFLKTIAGLLPPTSGKVEFGRLGRPNIISYLSQIRCLDYNCPLTVFDIVSMGFWPKINLFKKLHYSHKVIICNALKTVKLLDLLHMYIRNLSGGQFQRMLFARILVQKAPLILLDEPFQGIDRSICKIMLHAVYQLCNNSSCTVIAVLDNNELLNKKYFSDIFVLKNACSV